MRDLDTRGWLTGVTNIQLPSPLVPLRLHDRRHQMHSRFDQAANRSVQAPSLHRSGETSSLTHASGFHQLGPIGSILFLPKYPRLSTLAAGSKKYALYQAECASAERRLYYCSRDFRKCLLRSPIARACKALTEIDRADGRIGDLGRTPSGEGEHGLAFYRMARARIRMATPTESLSKPTTYGFSPHEIFCTGSLTFSLGAC
jgi:hypothetical protein